MADRKRRILIAPGAFKGTLSAPEAAELMRGFLAANWQAPGLDLELDACPVADGGDDTLQVLRSSDAAFETQHATVTGPLPDQRVTAEFLWHPAKKLVVLEAAQAHGYKLLPDGQLAPMAATSYGVGELFRAALAHQPETIVITLGGSASTDGGLGALQALGVRFLDEHSQRIEPPIGGQALADIRAVEWLGDWMFPGRILIATDVINPLLGPEGTAAVFAPQKGATAAQCAQLEDSLTEVSRLMQAVSGVDYSGMPGTGAAGGLAYGLRHLPRSGIISGCQWVAEQQNLQARIQAADLIITGEGRLDVTSLSGKATGQVLSWAGNKPVFIVCGQVQEGLAFPDNISVCPLAFSVDEVAQAMRHPREYLLDRLGTLLDQFRFRLDG